MAVSRLCSIPDCGKPARTRGWCGMHYYRWLKHGSPFKTVKIPNGETQRFFESVVLKHSTDECLIWPFSDDARGYGAMTLNGKRGKAHIFVCEHFHGPRPSVHHDAAHSCGKGHLGCCAPSHLSWKTRSENHQDRRKHETYQLGELNPDAKLTTDQVHQIISLKGKMFQREIATLFGVSRENISAIHCGKSWSHLRDNSEFAS